MEFEQKKIEANVTIRSTYDDDIWMIVKDSTSGIRFLELHFTREQFINMLMNQLAECRAKSAVVNHLELVGMKEEYRSFEFEIPGIGYNHKEQAQIAIKAACPEGWVPDIGFGCQDSFFERNGKRYARTTIRRWVRP